MTPKKDHALALAAAGYRVFPLVINGKTPANPGNWRKAATTDPARVAEMWTDPVLGAEIDYNIGVALPEDILVFDEDVSEGKQGDKSRQLLEMVYDEIPATFTVRTARGGLHRYYLTSTAVANSASKVGKHIDIKSEGGFVVGPGSTIDGVAYEIVDSSEIAEAPQWLIDLAGARKERKADTSAPLTGVDQETAAARAADWLTNHAPEAVEGAGGDCTTIQVANRVGDFGLSAAATVDLMLDHWNETKALPPWDADELEQKVNSAFRSRQNPIGIASAEAEFDAVEIDTEKPAPKRRGLYAVRWGDAKPTLDRPYLIDDVIDAGAMVVTYGDSNAGKTYAVLDQCFHIAAGKDWNGHKVQQGLVVYVAAEGGAGFFKRIEAFKRHYGVTDLPFSVVPCPIDLQSENSDTKRLVKLIREEEAHFGMKCVLVVVDTLARAMAGGDENSPVDMGKFVGHSDAIRAATGAAVDTIHHTGKDKARGARGHSSLRAATDTEIEVRPGEMEVTKQRDMPPSKPLKFELVGVEIGARADGKSVTACVVRWVEENEFTVELSPNAQAMLDVLEELTAAERDRIDAEGQGLESDKTDIWIPWKMWELSCLSLMTSTKGGKVARTSLFMWRSELSSGGRVARDKQNQWRMK